MPGYDLITEMKKAFNKRFEAPYLKAREASDQGSFSLSAAWPCTWTFEICGLPFSVAAMASMMGRKFGVIAWPTRPFMATTQTSTSSPTNCCMEIGRKRRSLRCAAG